MPLGLLLLVSQGPDWVELVCSTGVALTATERYSHSIVAVLVGAAVVSLLYGLVARDLRGSVLVAGVYLTHPVLDLLTGAKVLWRGGPLVGAALYEHPGLDFAVEAVIVLAGWLVYQRRNAVSRRRLRAHGALILGTLLVCQGILDLGQKLRQLRNASDTPNWPFAAGRLHAVPILGARAAESPARFVARSDN